MHASLSIGIAMLLAFAAGGTESESQKFAAAPHPVVSQPTAEQLAAWIKDLDASEFDVREQASAKLIKAGESALAALKAVQAVKSNEETLARVGAIVQEIRMQASAFRVLSAEGLKATASGLKMRVIEEGKGTPPKDTDYIELRYKAALEDGKELKNLFRSRTAQTLHFCCILKGWKEVLQTLKPGGKVVLAVPPELMNGRSGDFRAPKNSTVLFEVELVRVVPQGEPLPQISTSSGGPNWCDNSDL